MRRKQPTILISMLLFALVCCAFSAHAAKSDGAVDADSWEFLNASGEEAFARGDLIEAGKFFRKALNAAKSLGGRDPRLAHSLHNLAFLNYEAGNNARAEVLFERAIILKQALYGEGHGEVAWSLLGAAGASRNQGKFAEAETALKRAIHIYRNVHGYLHPSVAVATRDLGIVYLEQQDDLRAKSELLRSLSIWKDTYGVDHDEYKKTLSAYRYHFKEEPRLSGDDEITIRFAEVDNHFDAVEAITSLGISRAIAIHDDTINVLVPRGILTKKELLKAIAGYKRR